VSVKATTWVWENSEASGNARLVLLAIADAADQGGENAWPSQATIASMCRISVRTVRRLVAELVELGELEVIEHGGAAYREDRRPHRYRLVKMAGHTGGHSDPPLPPRPPNGRTTERHGRTNPVARADTGDPITSSLDPSLRTTTPSGGSASADASTPEEEPMPQRTSDQPALFEVARTEPRQQGKTAAQAIVAAFVDSHRQAHGSDPGRAEIGRVARDAASLLRTTQVEHLLAAATAMGRTPYANLGVQLKIVNRTASVDKGRAPAHPHGASEWSRGAEAVHADAQAVLESSPELAAWMAGQAATA
jgi:hypothetical protein